MTPEVDWPLWLRCRPGDVRRSEKVIAPCSGGWFCQLCEREFAGQADAHHAQHMPELDAYLASGSVPESERRTADRRPLIGASPVGLTDLLRHAKRFGADSVYETAEDEFVRAYRLPPPVDLTWMSEANREQVFEERAAALAAWKLAVRRELAYLRCKLAQVRPIRYSGHPVLGSVGQKPSPVETRLAVACCRDERGLSDEEVARELGIGLPAVARASTAVVPDDLVSRFRARNQATLSA